MKLIYHKGRFPNFGDELSPFIFEKVFSSKVFQTQPDIDLYGVGSILDDRVNKDHQNIIIGTGVRGYNLLKLGRKSSIYFLRGPLSARILGDDNYSLLDTAYLLKFIIDTSKNQLKDIKPVGIMPYYLHMDKYNWSFFEKLTGIRVIDPRWTIEKVIDSMCSCEKIITGAMHGAIVADILRIPWMRMRLGLHGFETIGVSEFKWMDWSMSLGFNDLSVINVTQYPSRINSPIGFVELVLKSVKKSNKNFLLSDEKFLNTQYDSLYQRCAQFARDFELPLLV